MVAVVMLAALFATGLVVKGERGAPFQLTRGQVSSTHHWFGHEDKRWVQHSAWVVEGGKLDSVISDVSRSCPESAGWRYGQAKFTHYWDNIESMERLEVWLHPEEGPVVLRERAADPWRYALAWLETPGRVENH